MLIDFWTYSCINCLRTLPHLKAWDARLPAATGSSIVGVHTPGVRVRARARRTSRGAVQRLGVSYPVVQDNKFGTWNNYSNQYWPAEYMIDRKGHVRHIHFGEGELRRDRGAIRKLLGADDGAETKVARRGADRVATRRSRTSATSGSTRYVGSHGEADTLSRTTRSRVAGRRATARLRR